MRVYRIYNHRARYATLPGFNPLDGAGGLTSSGRWNTAGYPIVYTSMFASLALAEMLVHIPAALFGERILLTIQFDNKVSTERVSKELLLQLMRNASENNPQNTTQAYGSSWLREQRTLVLEVPSIAVPFEKNYLFNPLHPEMSRAKIVSSDIMALDKRVIELNAPKLP